MSDFSALRPAAQEIESFLHHHVLEAWFPRCLDVEFGGFLCDFDRSWRPCGPHNKQIEFQARQTWLAADAFAFTGNDGLRAAAVDGFRFLRDVMWDRDAGGWFHCMTREGAPLEAGTKHTHGFVYGIAACAAVHKATGEPGALELAREGFSWLEAHAHDKQYGGYFGFFKRDGSVIGSPAESPFPTKTDTIGTHVGLKDLNVHSDAIQALDLLYRIGSDPQVAERLAEIVQIVCDKFSTSEGAQTYACEPNWKPVPHLMRYGQSFQNVHRLLSAGEVLGAQEAKLRCARRFMDFTLEYAWDAKLGCAYHAGPASYPLEVCGHDLRVRRTEWWVQFEALRALLALSSLVEDNQRYVNCFLQLWTYLNRFVIDSSYRGVFTTAREPHERWWRTLGGRWLPADLTRKGSVWKDGSHEGLTSLYCIAALRR